MKMPAVAATILTLLATGTTVRADEWDVASDTDNGLATDNSLFHGAEQIHDMAALGGVPDQDWYLIAGREFSSYQFVVDGLTGDLDFDGTDVQRMDTSGVVLQSGTATDSDTQVTINTIVGAASVFYVRVQGAACGSSCSSQARYRARFYDTTYTIPRFNNSGTQSTVLIVQNASDRTCDGFYQFFRNDGTRVHERPFLLNPAQLEVLPLATVSQLAGTSGSVRVVHTCGYGGLSGKAVSLEPSTGFTFETPLVPRPH
jgi:hypothetical protein